MSRGSTAALPGWGAPVARLMMMPFSCSASSLYNRLLALSSKTTRYRHHVTNLQTYISSQRPPKTLRPRNSPGFLLLPEEQIRWDTACEDAAMKLSRIALQAAHRHLIEAQENFKTATQDLDSIDASERSQIKARIVQNVQRLESALLKIRIKIWQRDGVKPSPLHRQHKSARGTRAGKRHQRHKRAIRTQQNSDSRSDHQAIHNSPPVRARETTSTLPVSCNVVNLSKCDLSAAEESLLRRGLSFCPSTGSLNTHRLSLDLHAFYRRVRLRDFFYNHPSNEADEERSVLDMTNLRQPSVWQPPKTSITPEVNVFINSFHRGVVSAIHHTPRVDELSRADNLSPAERQALVSLSKRRDIVIKPADKGSAVVIWTTTDYEREAMRQLSDTARYERLEQDPTAANNAKVKQTVERLLMKNSINRNTARDLQEKKPKAARFYLLPKIHKSITSPPGRPIISSNGCPTERISAFVDTLLKPLVTTVPSFIRDTKHLLNELAALPELPPHALLVTMDVVGLYNNIPHSDGVAACRRALDKRPVFVPPTNDIIELMELVLDRNCFSFNGHHYRQILGTAMGTRMAPSFANLFMADLEEKILETAPNQKRPDFFKRFIDDLLMVWLHGLENLQRFFAHANSAHPKIRFTMEHGKRINMLDTQLTLQDDGHIASDLYTKPTDSHQYLLPSSNHPPHVHEHLPYGLALRLRQIVSEDNLFHARLLELKAFLEARGYKSSNVQSQLDKAAATPRTTALECRRRDPTERIPLVCDWNEHLPDLGRLLRQFQPILQSTDDLASCFSQTPLLSYRRPRNLRDILVHADNKALAPTGTNLVPGTFQCLHPRCKTCRSISNITAVATKTGRNRPIRDHMTCDTASLVYLITCSACNAAYVGETGNKLRERLNGHRADIRNKRDTPVGVHFNMANHNLRVSGLERTGADTTSRRVREKKWIGIVAESQAFTCMNRDNGIDFLVL